MAGAELHRFINVGWVHPGLVEEVNGREEVREEQAVDDEAGQVWNRHCRLAERLAERRGALTRGLGRLIGKGQLDQRHTRHRVEDVEANEALR